MRYHNQLIHQLLLMFLVFLFCGNIACLKTVIAKFNLSHVNFSVQDKIL